MNHAAGNVVTLDDYVGKSEAQLRAGWQSVADFIEAAAVLRCRLASIQPADDTHRAAASGRGRVPLGRQQHRDAVRRFHPHRTQGPLFEGSNVQAAHQHPRGYARESPLPVLSGVASRPTVPTCRGFGVRRARPCLRRSSAPSGCGGCDRPARAGTARGRRLPPSCCSRILDVPRDARLDHGRHLGAGISPSWTIRVRLSIRFQVSTIKPSLSKR